VKERWRGEWRAKGRRLAGDAARRTVNAPSDKAGRIAELERKIGQLTI